MTSVVNEGDLKRVYNIFTHPIKKYSLIYSVYNVNMIIQRVLPIDG